MEFRAIAIDGPVASGKTVAAKHLAAAVGSLYLDTGALYRAAAYLALKNQVDYDNEAAIVRLLERHPVALVADPSAEAGYRILVDGLDTGTRLFDPDVAAAVSTVAALGGVRAALVERQRAMAREGPVVMAGRDIGTVVLPEAPHKFFLTASVDERAKRRYEEFAARGLDLSLDEVRAQVLERDRLDTTRAFAPLRAADDAITIDSTALSPQEVVETMRAHVEGGA